MQATPEQIQAIVSKIVETAKPQKVILFGSYAYGTPNKDSDLDILVIKETDLSNREVSAEIYGSLYGFMVPMDILVYKPKEVEHWAPEPLAFITNIISKGKVLYEA